MFKNILVAIDGSPDSDEALTRLSTSPSPRTPD